MLTNTATACTTGTSYVQQSSFVLFPGDKATRGKRETSSFTRQPAFVRTPYVDGCVVVGSTPNVALNVCVHINFKFVLAPCALIRDRVRSFMNVRCYTCNLPLARFESFVDRSCRDGKALKTVLNELGIRRMCCRTAFTTKTAFSFERDVSRVDAVHDHGCTVVLQSAERDIVTDCSDGSPSPMEEDGAHLPGEEET